MENIVRTIPLTEEEQFDNALEKCRLENLKKEKDFSEKEIKRIRSLLRANFPVVIIPGPNYKKKRTNLRNLKSKDIGKLININAIVVKVSEVSPLMDTVSYVCEKCHAEIHRKINSESFDPPRECMSKICRDNKSSGKLV